MKLLLSKRLATTGIVMILLLLDFALRVHKVASVPVSFDEIRTLRWFVPLSFIDIFTEFHSNNHPMASALAHLFSPQADNLFMMRWPMILVGMLALPFVYRLGAETFGRKVGLVALLLFSASHIYLGYSAIVRGYIGLISLTAITHYFLWRALRYNRWLAWLAFVIVNVMLMYFHLFGVLAAWTQLGLVGLWLGWGWWQTRQTRTPVSRQLKQRWLRFGMVVVLLAAIQLPIIYFRTTSVLAESLSHTFFDVWRNQEFSLTEDISPLTRFVGLMGPISPGGIGTYLYLAFFIMGLIYVGRRWPGLAVGTVVWFVLPFVAVFIGMRVLGETFYVHVRFLSYLLPSYLILTAVGLVSSAEWLAGLAEGRSKRWHVAARGLIAGGVVGVLILAALSVWWYKLASYQVDWRQLATVVAGQIKPQDIVICDEDQGFDIPDRAKAYCVWMLDIAVPDLEEYTPRLQDSTSDVADYDQLLAQRRAMLEPGSVWLVIWHRLVIFYPHLLAPDQKPPVASWPPPASFEPYQIWPFGAAMLVHVDSEATLLGNLAKALELLIRLEDSAADKARYYRSLAEIAAMQGQKQQANDFFERSWAMVEQAGGQYPDLFLMETASVIERIPDGKLPPTDAVEAGYSFGPSLCLENYELFPLALGAGDTLSLTVYWQTLDLVDKDYNFFLQIEDKTGQVLSRFEFEPFNRTYPTPWWWADQQLVEQRDFMLPADLPPQDYVVSLGAYDRQTGNDEITRPLFLLLHQPEMIASVQWLVEPNSAAPADCP